MVRKIYIVKFMSLPPPGRYKRGQFAKFLKIVSTPTHVRKSYEALHHIRELVGCLGVRVGTIWLYTKNELDLRFIMISQQTRNLYFMLVWIVTN